MRFRSVSRVLMVMATISATACSGTSGEDASSSSGGGSGSGTNPSSGASGSSGGSTTSAGGGSSLQVASSSQAGGSSSRAATSAGASSDMPVSGGTSGTSNATSAADSGSNPSSGTDVSGTSGASGGSSSTASGQASSGSGGSSSSGANPLEGQACTMGAECGAGSGLECLTGFCRVRCTTPEAQSNCREGQVCLTLTTPADTHVCFTLPTRDDGCLGGRCADGLECRSAEYSSMGEPVNTADFPNACQQPCSPALPNQGCGQGEQCFPHPGLSNFADIQLNAQGQRVTCTTPGMSAACDAGNGFGCMAFASGNACARQFGFCGAGIAPWNFNLPFTSEENLVCNWGPELMSTSGQLLQAGSVGCTPVTAAPAATVCARRPLETVWEGDGFDRFPGFGLCMGICDSASATTPRFTTACNPGYTCDYSALHSGQPTPPVDCTQAGQSACDAVDTRLVCINVPESTQRTCVYRFGICQPD